MKKKEIINLIIGCVLTLAISAGLLSYATFVCERKDSKYRLESFFESKSPIDVMFYGSSHMINGVFPNYLWRDYGISSYNFASHADFVPSTYWAMKNSLDYASPKLVVIDCYTIADAYKVCGYSYLHGWMDAFPMSTTKLEAIFDLTDDPLRDEMIEKGLLPEDSSASASEFIWDFCKYHSRWNEIYDESFVTSVATERGAEERINIYPMNKVDRISDDRIYEEDSLGIEYLQKIIDECKAQNIEVLLTYIPFAAMEDRQMQANRAGEIARENGINFINFLDLDIIDYSMDFYDDTHLNPLGAAKITDYIGEYISSNYAISDHRGEESFAGLDEEYSKYKYHKTEVFTAQDDINNCLLMLKDSDFDAIIEIKDESFWLDETSAKLISLIAGEGCDIPHTKGVIVKDSQSGKVSLYENMPQELEEYMLEEREDGTSASTYTVKMLMLDRSSNERVLKIF